MCLISKLQLDFDTKRMLKQWGMFNVAQSWKPILQSEFEKSYWQTLTGFLEKEYLNNTIFPPKPQVFRSMGLAPFNSIKVVIIGQDPYHGEGQANGLCFSVNKKVTLPPSLKNIFKELQDDLGILNTSGDLSNWASQGVLLLNSTLTVKKGLAGSHQLKGWEQFTDHIIKKVSSKLNNIVFILWGSYAIKKGEVIDKTKHFCLSSAHPSPFSANRGFFGSKPFSKTNIYLRKHNLNMIDWST